MGDEDGAAGRFSLDSGPYMMRNKGWQAAGMIDMPVREDNETDIQKIDAHCKCIIDEEIRIPAVEEDFGIAILDIKGNSRFTPEVAIN